MKSFQVLQDELYIRTVAGFFITTLPSDNEVYSQIVRN